MLALTITIGVLGSASGCSKGANDAVNETRKNIYVSPKGDDANGDGSEDAPFASIQKAKEYVRTVKKSDGDIIVELAVGFYPLSETVVFDENDSGNKDSRVIYRAANGAKPI